MSDAPIEVVFIKEYSYDWDNYKLSVKITTYPHQVVIETTLRNKLTSSEVVIKKIKVKTETDGTRNLERH